VEIGCNLAESYKEGYGSKRATLAMILMMMDHYRQSVGLLGRVIRPVARPLPTQDNTKKEEMRTDICASSGIRTHDPSVWVDEDSS
jgi:hypothetical protein